MKAITLVTMNVLKTTSMYYIYEIASERKVGVTDNIERRRKEHVERYGISPREFIILESYTDIHIASERELEIQRAKGYEVDIHPYWFVVQVQKKRASTPQAQKKRVANTDLKAKAANTDYKAREAKVDKKAIMSHRQRGIIAIDPDGTRTMYSGMEEACRQLKEKTGINFYSSSISNVCNANLKYYKTHKGYKFEYT